MIDEDGSHKYSPLANATINANRLTFNIVPNPVYGSAVIQFAENVKKVNLQLSDMTGKLIFERAEAEINGGMYQLDTENLEKGIYILKATLNNESYNAKLIKY